LKFGVRDDYKKIRLSISLIRAQTPVYIPKNRTSSWGSDNSASRMLSDLERGNEDPYIKK
jgi:hypothetical protein